MKMAPPNFRPILLGKKKSEEPLFTMAWSANDTAFRYHLK
jgi:hypothetical protein